MGEPRDVADDAVAEFIEAGCIAVYGKNWDGPEEKRPGEPMKRVWRDLVAKAQAPVLAALRSPGLDRDGERMRMREACARAAETAPAVKQLLFDGRGDATGYEIRQAGPRDIAAVIRALPLAHEEKAGC